MDEDFNISQNDNYQDSKVKKFLSSFIISISFILIVIFIATNYCPPINKVYSPQAYYTGKYSVEISNPRDIYNNMISAKNLSVTVSKCKIEPTYLQIDSDQLFMAGGNNDLAWPVKGAKFGSYNDKTLGEIYSISSFDEESESISDDTNYNHWYLWQNEGSNEIISPWANVKFVNANVDDHGQIIKVMASSAVGEGEIRWIEFRNIKNWFCHAMLSEHTESHTIRIGNNPDNGAPSSLGELGQGYAILGTANKNTYMVGMSQVPGGTAEEIHPYYVFHPDEPLP